MISSAALKSSSRSENSKTRTAVWSSRVTDLTATASSALLEKLQITNPRAQKTVPQFQLVLVHVPYKNDGKAVDEVGETLKKACAKVKMVELMINEVGRRRDGC